MLELLPPALPYLPPAVRRRHGDGRTDGGIGLSVVGFGDGCVLAV